MSKAKPIVLVIHDIKDRKMVQEIGICALCDEPVYLSGRGMSGEASAEDIKKMDNPKFVGRECVIDMIDFLFLMMQMPYGMREQIKQEVMKVVSKE